MQFWEKKILKFFCPMKNILAKILTFFAQKSDFFHFFGTNFFFRPKRAKSDPNHKTWLKSEKNNFPTPKWPKMGQKVRKMAKKCYFFQNPKTQKCHFLAIFSHFWALKSLLGVGKLFFDLFWGFDTFWAKKKFTKILTQKSHILDQNNPKNFFKKKISKNIFRLGTHEYLKFSWTRVFMHRCDFTRGVKLTPPRPE